MSWEDPLPAARLAFRRGSRSFAAASLLFDVETRRDVTLLYAWCRYCDDLIDGQTLGQERAVPRGTPAMTLAWLEARTRAAFAPAPCAAGPFLALQQVAARRGIPLGLALDHLAGFAMDVGGCEYETIADTLRYCHHIAGVVGLMMARIMGVETPEMLGRACDLGIGFQLTNIARDVIEDAQHGRVYLPRAWLREAGLDPARLGQDCDRAALARIVVRLLDQAELYYRSAALGIAALPWRNACAIAAAAAIYRDIGQQVRKLGAGAWDRRATTSAARKAWLGARSLAATLAVTLGPHFPDRPAGAALARLPEPEPGGAVLPDQKGSATS